MAVQMGRYLLSTPELGVIISNLQMSRYLMRASFSVESYWANEAGVDAPGKQDWR